MLSVEKVFQGKSWKKFGKRMRIRKQGHRNNVHIASDAPGTDGRFFIVVVEEDFEALAKLFSQLAKTTKAESQATEVVQRRGRPSKENGAAAN